MEYNLFKKGDKIRLKVPLISSGWIGIGTIDRDQLWPGQTIHFRRNGYDDSDYYDVYEACPHEVEKL